MKSGSAGSTLASGVTLGLLASFTCPLHYLATVGFEVAVERLKVYVHCMLDKVGPHFLCCSALENIAGFLVLVLIAVWLIPLAWRFQ